jgi:hypothetical protein
LLIMFAIYIGFRFYSSMMYRVPETFWTKKIYNAARELGINNRDDVLILIAGDLNVYAWVQISNQQGWEDIFQKSCSMISYAWLHISIVVFTSFLTKGIFSEEYFLFKPRTKNKDSINPYHLSVCLIKKWLQAILAFYSYKNVIPIWTASVIASIIYIVYLLAVKPYKSMKTVLLHVIGELTFLINLFVVVIGTSKTDDMDLREILGLTYLIVCMAALVLGVILTSLDILNIFKRFKSKWSLPEGMRKLKIANFKVSSNRLNWSLSRSD